MMNGEMYEAMQKGSSSINIPGILLLNILLIVVIYLFVGAVYAGIRKVTKKPDILKGRMARIIGTVALDAVLVVLQLSALL